MDGIGLDLGANFLLLSLQLRSIDRTDGRVGRLGAREEEDREGKHVVQRRELWSAHTHTRDPPLRLTLRDGKIK